MEEGEGGRRQRREEVGSKTSSDKAIQKKKDLTLKSDIVPL